MLSLSSLVLGLYALVLLGLGFFGVHRLKMLVLYWRASRRAPVEPPRVMAADEAGAEPLVCVQCPLFNEPLMVDALLDHVTALAWPAARREIQVLDDSTDETPQVVQRWLAAHPDRAIGVVHLRRTDRTGYKAGALSEGMRRSSAEFFAVFDADFRPAPDFLTTLMPHFAAPTVGVVQARWEFANRRASLLTRFQAVFLDAHFVVEQAARAAGGLFFNFNGTAGIWRRAALEAAGGWTSDTVTEDLDASYRAQLAGWRFVYLDRYAVPSELPENLTAFKSQQRRWTKGGIQVARKLLGTILRSDQPGRIKREAFNHLTVGLVHPLLMLFSILFVPYLYLTGGRLGGGWLIFNPIFVLLAGGTSVAFYVTGQFFRRGAWREGLVWLVASPLVLAFGLAMSVTCCAAVLEGACTRGGEFVRTPKGGRQGRTGGLMAPWRHRTWFAGVLAVEVGFGVVMALAAVHFARVGLPYTAWVLGIKSAGFLGLAWYSTRDFWPAPAVLSAARA